MDEALADVQDMWDAAGIPHEVITLSEGEVVRSGSPESAERVNSSFGLIHSGLAYSLLCGVPREALSGDVDEARGRWLSLAETFEFLPAEE